MTYARIKFHFPPMRVANNISKLIFDCQRLREIDLSLIASRPDKRKGRLHSPLLEPLIRLSSGILPLFFLGVVVSATAPPRGTFPIPPLLIISLKFLLALLNTFCSLR